MARQGLNQQPPKYQSDGSNLCTVILSDSNHHLSHLMTKPTKWHVRPAKAQISLGICPVWSESSLCTQWVAKDPSFLHVDSEDSDQTRWMTRLIWVFAGRTVILLVLSWVSSFYIRPSMTKLCETPNTSLVTRKPVFGVEDQVRLKAACSAIEPS